MNSIFIGLITGSIISGFIIDNWWGSVIAQVLIIALIWLLIALNESNSHD